MKELENYTPFSVHPWYWSPNNLLRYIFGLKSHLVAVSCQNRFSEPSDVCFLYAIFLPWRSAFPDWDSHKALAFFTKWTLHGSWAINSSSPAAPPQSDDMGGIMNHDFMHSPHQVQGVQHTTNRRLLFNLHGVKSFELARKTFFPRLTANQKKYGIS